MNSKDVCRSCLSADGGLLSMESVVDGSLNISDCLRAHLNVNKPESDGLPQKMCLNCFDELQHIRKFHLRFLQSEESLLSQFVESCKTTNISEVSPIIDVDFQSDSERQNHTIVVIADAMIKDGATQRGGANLKAADSTSQFDIQIQTGTIDEAIACWSGAGRKNGKDVERISSHDSPAKEGAQIKSKRTNNNTSDEQVKGIYRRPNPNSIFCLQCNRTFDNRNTLRTHFHSVHGEDNAKGFCIKCSKTFPNRGVLMTHLLGHTVERRVKCNFCDRTFGSSAKCRSHERTHTGEKPYVCKVCGRAFRQTSILGTHMRLHTGKTVECPKCDKKFSRKSMMKIHLRWHDDVRPYECHMCDKKYRIKSHLSEHLAKHSDERNHMCEMCGQSFRTKLSLKSHMTIHTRPYRCPKCPLATSNSWALRTHLTRMHGIHDDPKLYKSSIPIYEREV